MVRVKFCGIRRGSDALAASRLGIHALGFIFVKDTPRYISPDKAAEITNILSPFIMKVGVFMNPEISELESTAAKCKLDIIQLHGEEDSLFCSQVKDKYRVIKTLKVKNRAVLKEIPKYKNAVDAILLDTFSEKAAGGTGESFNWEIAKDARSFGVPIVLSGGLNPDNIKDALRGVNPYAVDVSSGIEQSPGVKDQELMGRFIASIWEEEWGL
ncbi:MAG: phosphoribosylanthranilate isomerase [Candidatus Kaelpia aquatica]|nr:phosphoribosylanthranilate isomerase [Candidatus Kaelpia aquatica]